MPFGVMCGYILASIFVDAAARATDCAGLLCWRWPLLIEIILLSPLYMCLYFVHKENLQIGLGAKALKPTTNSQTDVRQPSGKTESSSKHPAGGLSLKYGSAPLSSKSDGASQETTPPRLSLQHPTASGSMVPQSNRSQVMSV